MPFDSGLDSAVAPRCCDLTAGVDFDRFATAVGESGKDAGRLVEDAGVKGLEGDVVWNVDALILEGLR